MKMTREDIDVTSYFVSVTGWVTGESVITGYLIPNRGPFSFFVVYLRIFIMPAILWL